MFVSKIGTFFQSIIKNFYDDYKPEKINSLEEEMSFKKTALDDL